MAGTTGDTRTELEERRLFEMKDLYLSGYRFSEMVPVLHADGLIGCQNCSDPSKQRRNSRGDLVCRTCENTLSVFWNRNEASLKLEPKDVDRVKWEWKGVQQFILRACHRHHLRKAVIRTTKTEITTDPVTKQERELTTTTEREEWRVDRGLLSLMSAVADKIARVGGMDLDEPDADETVSRGKVTFETPDGDQVVM